MKSTELISKFLKLFLRKALWRTNILVLTIFVAQNFVHMLDSVYLLAITGIFSRLAQETALFIGVFASEAVQN